MDFVTILLAALSLAGAIVLKLGLTELQDWLPTIARRLVDRAVTRLPDDQRERYREELYAHLEECPGKIAKLVQAVSFLLRSAALRNSLSSVKNARRLQAPGSTRATTEMAAAQRRKRFGLFDFANMSHDSIHQVILLSNLERHANDPDVREFLAKIGGIESDEARFFSHSAIVTMLKLYRNALTHDHESARARNVIEKLTMIV